jgi:hypothetical protein
MPRQFDKVAAKYGAPVGRATYGNINEVQGKVSLFHVQLEQGYDDGGAYWGGPNDLYCARLNSENYQQFVRAPSRETARILLGIPQEKLQRATGPWERPAKPELLRRVTFRPYGKCRPFFTVCLYDRVSFDDRHYPYQLKRGGTMLFEGADFGPAPMHCIDSDHAVEALMSFLTLRPGDTDEDYFKNYTPEQLAFCDEHAEALNACVQDWFDRRNGESNDH